MSARVKEDPHCLEYAQQHSIMLLLLLLFFGVLVVPRFYKHVEYPQLQKTNGVIKTIYYSQYAPLISFVEITYKLGGKEYTVREILHQHVQVGDHVDIFVGKDKKTIQFKQPPLLISLLILLSYFIIISLCVYAIYWFFTKKN